MSDYSRSTTSSAGTTGTSQRNWRDYEDTFRSDYERQYGKNRSWDEHGPAYRYGWERGGEDRYRDRGFSDVESDLQRDFSDRYDTYRNEHQGHSVGAHQTVGGKAEHLWENFKDTVREGFDRARMGR
jgi:hypothetical protein